MVGGSCAGTGAGFDGGSFLRLDAKPSNLETTTEPRRMPPLERIAAASYCGCDSCAPSGAWGDSDCTPTAAGGSLSHPMRSLRGLPGEATRWHGWRVKTKPASLEPISLLRSCRTD